MVMGRFIPTKRFDVNLKVGVPAILIPAILIMENPGRNNLLDKSPPFCYNSVGEVSTT